MTKRSILLIAALTLASPLRAITLKVMKQGLGNGTITSVPPGINCPGTCRMTVTSAIPIELHFSGTGSFQGWSGDCSGMGACSFMLDGDKAVHAKFDPVPAIPQITDFSPRGIRDYLAAHAPTVPGVAHVTTAAEFLAALPDEFKWNWIMMSRSESLQTGTAETPRFILPSRDGTRVFTFALKEHSSYPGAHHDAIEYMQFTPRSSPGGDDNFHFHEIVLHHLDAMGTAPIRERDVREDDPRCTRCHSTRNVLNRSTTLPGTTGVTSGLVVWKNKPNWDAYDSWGGMLPFNRDRIYEGTVEEVAFKRIFNLWTWENDDETRAFIEQLTLQPPSEPSDAITAIEGGPDDGQITMTFHDSPTPPSTSTITYNFDGTSGSPHTVNRGGRYLTLHHSDIPRSDEGRGVHFFDVLGSNPRAPNQLRIADELNRHRYSVGGFFVDPRPVALAVAKNCFRVNTAMDRVEADPVQAPGRTLTYPVTFFTQRNRMGIVALQADTRARAQGQTAPVGGRLEDGLPRRKVDIQRFNLDRTNDIYMRPSPPAPEPKNGLLQVYRGTAAPTIDQIRDEVFRRPRDLGFNDGTVMGGFFVDREENDFNAPRVALYRYFLEPLGISVDKWSMGVRGRSRTYTFADIFDSGYTPGLSGLIEDDLRSRPIDGFPMTAYQCTDLIPAVNFTLGVLPANADAVVPTFTDVQRIFNKACIECHGGLGYPPFDLFYRADYLDFSEDESSTTDRFDRSFEMARNFSADSANPDDSRFYQRITAGPEDCPRSSLEPSVMPCGGPRLSQADVDTIARWLVGPPRRAHSVGDPHIKTIDGTEYDFQAAGEFTLLRGEGIEVQTRHTPVATEGPLDNAYTGLSACVSLNTAAAFRVGPHRVTYEPNLNGRPDPSGMQLRVDGKLVTLDERGVALAGGGRIVRTSAPGGIEIQLPGGGDISVTPAFWDYYGLWHLNLEFDRVKATEGIMGVITRASWLPALPDATFVGPRSNDPHQRYQDLYVRFANAWRVTNQTSLFDYTPGTSTSTFTFTGWPAEAPQSCRQVPRPDSAKRPPLPPLTLQAAQQNCQGIVAADLRANCVQDVMVTGEASFAKAYLLTEQVQRNARPVKPVLVSPADNQINVPTTVTFTWNRTFDRDGDRVTYSQCVWEAGQRFTFNKCTTLPRSIGPLSGPYPCGLLVLLLILLLIVLFLLMRGTRFRIVWILVALVLLIAAFFVFRYDQTRPLSNKVAGLKPGTVYYWQVIVDDGKGGTTESPMQRFMTGNRR